MTTPPLIEWAVAARTLAGNGDSGDQHVVVNGSSGVLVGVVDGLGHGRTAAEAARTVTAELRDHSEEGLERLVERCHNRLLGKRGVVMSLAWFGATDGRMSWLGVGNVEGLHVRPAATASPAPTAYKGSGFTLKHLLLRGGVVGQEIPPLHFSTIDVDPGDILVLATDGVRTDFLLYTGFRQTPRQIADSILAAHGRMDDDALVLVARYLGSPR